MIIEVGSNLLEFVLLHIKLPPLLGYLIFSLLPLLIHPIGPLLGCLFGQVLILRPSESIGVEGMILFELLIKHVLLLDLLPLLHLVILVKSSERVVHCLSLTQDYPCVAVSVLIIDFRFESAAS